MKPRSLYIKIFISFIGVLLVTLLCISILFISTAGRSFRHNIDVQSIAKLTLLQKTIENKVADDPDIPVHQNQRILELLKTFSDLSDANIWATTPSGRVLMGTASFTKDLNHHQFKNHHIEQDGIHLYHLSRRYLNYYAQVPVQQNKIQTILHFHLEKKHRKRPHAFFLVGLMLIGGVVALLVIPLSRFITRRVKALNKAAIAFAKGNLGSRADIQGRDEIAELGRSFNFMADKLGAMLQSNKELTANISHELRSPLARIRVSKELIQSALDKDASAGPLASDLERYITAIDQDIDMMDDLIDKILALSRMDRQETRPDHQSIDLNSMIVALKKVNEPFMEVKGLCLNTRFADKPEIHADPDIMKSALSALMDNAVKYTPETGRIQIRTRQMKDGTIRLSISNTCAKLSEDTLKKIFEPFYRIDPSKTKGSGLGLTIIRKQLEHCNATIQARNTDDGIEFEIDFPEKSPQD